MNKFSRRDLLKTIGGLAFTLPLVGTSFWNPKDVFAEGALSASGHPKRFIYFFHPNGTIHDQWWPTGTQNDFAFKEILSPLTPLKSKIIIPKNLAYKSAAKDVSPGERHQSGMGTALSGMPLQAGSFVGGDGSLAGWGDGITVDQVIANHISEGTAYKSLHLGVRTDTTAATAEVRTRISYTGPAQPIPPQNDPSDVFQQVFGNFTPTDPMGGGEDDPKIRLQRSVLDHSLEQFKFVLKKAGQQDRIRLEAHQAMVRDLERRLSNPNVQGEACFIPEKPEAMAIDSEDTMPEISRLQIDLLVAALACDQTRVASIQYSNSKNHIRFPWIQSMGDGHQLSHSAGGGNAREEWIKRDKWLASEFAYLLQRLDSIVEGDDGTTLLDNCVIVWINELSEGPKHSHTNMPFVIAGSGGGYFKTGQYVDYLDRPHNDMLVSFQNAFGIDSQTFGDPRFVTGPLSDIT